MAPKSLAPRIRRFAPIGLVAVSTAGCGFALTHGPPAGHEHLASFSCTQSNTGPTLDALMAAAGILGAVVVAVEGDNYYVDPGVVTASYLVQFLIYGPSAVVGFRKTGDCREAQRHLADRLAVERSRPSAESIVDVVFIRPLVDTLDVGGHTQLRVTAMNSSGSAIGGRVFAWSSSNDAIASVTRTGQVTAHAAGEVVIAVSMDNVVGTARIVVLSGR